MPVRVISRRHRVNRAGTRRNSRSSCSTLGSCSASSLQCKACCCCCCCCCHQSACRDDLFSTVGPMFTHDDGLKGKSEAAATLLLWLLMVLQFLVKCIRFFSVHYELTGLTEKDNLYSFLNQHWPTKVPAKRQRAVRHRSKNRLSKGYFTATTRSEASSSEALLSPVAIFQEGVGKIKHKTVWTVPAQLSPLYTSKGAPSVAESNYVTCVFEFTGSKVAEVVDDIRSELYAWRRRFNLVTLCCELTWSVEAGQRHVPSESDIHQAVLDHMHQNQQRIDAIALALYHADGWLSTLPSKPLTPIVQQNCLSRNGTTLGCYRRVYPSLMPLIHGETADVHEPYWALRTIDQLPTVRSSEPKSTFQLNLICATLDERFSY